MPKHSRWVTEATRHLENLGEIAEPALPLTTQWRRDLEWLETTIARLHDLTQHESQLTGLVGMQRWKWQLRLEDATSYLTRYQEELQQRLCHAVAERLDAPPLPTGDVENPPLFHRDDLDQQLL